MATKIRTRRISDKIKLNNHDINVVSAIVQKTNLPSEMLIRYAKNSNVSPAALRVIYVLLDDLKVVKKGKVLAPSKVEERVASDFHNWATKLRKA